jgi:hypothetical protein
MEKNMLQEFIEQNYLIIESNVVTNIVIWNGDTTQWTPPQGSIALIQATTPAMVWVLNSDNTEWVLGEQIGAGSIGFTWDGTVLTTNEPQPPKPAPQPVTTGTMAA